MIIQHKVCFHEVRIVFMSSKIKQHKAVRQLSMYLMAVK